ncbi:GPP34 family phosphoprotein [Streptomyces sp. NPDC006285]|uniref:GOLPH3/VPS74 family protein n=1 Tax=Streptomyces sp. NPDC006285 TaxID=3364742 RepID=UPI003688D448
MTWTLAQRLFLLCYSLEKEKFELADHNGRGAVLRAAALAELSLDGKLTTVSGNKVVRSPGQPPSDPFLADVWNDVSADEPQRWLPLVHHKAHTAQEPVRAQLAATDTITVRRHKRLGVLPVDRVTLDDTGPVVALRDGLRDAVLSGAGQAARLPLPDAVTAVFAAEVEMNSVFTRTDRREHKETFATLAVRVDDALPGLRRALHDTYLSNQVTGGG